MDTATAPYGMTTTVRLPYERAVERTHEALGGEGFGVLTEIDVKATFKKKLDVDFRQYVILGACNPSLAYRALTEERNLGLLLPCNVVVYAGDDEGESIVAAIDPEVSLGRVGNEDLAPIAADVKARLPRARHRARTVASNAQALVVLQRARQKAAHTTLVVRRSIVAEIFMARAVHRPEGFWLRRLREE
jgi:uncharacterized protein (DUF302 family)